MTFSTETAVVLGGRRRRFRRGGGLLVGLADGLGAVADRVNEPGRKLPSGNRLGDGVGTLRPPGQRPGEAQAMSSAWSGPAPEAPATPCRMLIGTECLTAAASNG